MGYYTKFKLEISDNKKLSEITERVLEDTSYWISDTYSEEYKFYKSDEYFKGLSQEYSDIEISLYGLGEDADLPWKNVYKNGNKEEYSAEIKWVKSN